MGFEVQNPNIGWGSLISAFIMVLNAHTHAVMLGTRNPMVLVAMPGRCVGMLLDLLLSVGTPSYLLPQDNLHTLIGSNVHVVSLEPPAAMFPST